MRILNDRNEIIDLDMTNTELHFSVLSFRDLKQPDFFFEELTHIEVIEASAITLQIGPFRLVMPLVWHVLVSDYDNVESVPLWEAHGKPLNVVCVNPIDGFSLQFLPLNTRAMFPRSTWTCPPMGERDMLVVPLGESGRSRLDRTGKPVRVGPTCAVFTATKMDLNRPLSDIWSG
jgi:hypothetical protein